MKPYFLFICFMLAGEARMYSQEGTAVQGLPVDATTGLITYQEVVTEEGTKQELFNRCIDWVNNYFANPVSVTKIRDFETGRIEGRHQFRITYLESGHEMDAGLVLYSFIIELKEGRYRYTITDFVLKKASRFPVENWLDKTDPAYNEQWDNYLKQVDDYSKGLIENLKEKMKLVPEVKEEEW